MVSSPEWLQACVQVCACDRTPYMKRPVYTVTDIIVRNRSCIEQSRQYDDDMNDVFSPNHLLYGRRLETTNINSTNIENIENINIRNRVDYVEINLIYFWKIWRKEYVTSIRQRQKITSKKSANNIKENDVVIIYEDKQPRHLWKLGKITKIIYGNDRKFWGAELKVGRTNAIINRPAPIGILQR